MICDMIYIYTYKTFTVFLIILFSFFIPFLFIYIFNQFVELQKNKISASFMGVTLNLLSNSKRTKNFYENHSSFRELNFFPFDEINFIFRSTSKFP